ncbi:hypothetical protein PSV09DRAFT_2263312 [Bipolaris maydis]|uniref:uncharacterized protein n=1 Tax=Cochliobolus heterostrophus TaxID=5016 RepID=UPI0024DC5E72|nr:hypothetical protein J3E74DRAFT_295618 [Bipolaris maydis]KAJ6203671.1 hypothetical protein PSV09DRAFT_2263312 [Bipolaris maydis]KAJ6267336.1 hypothetical protein PSV08DRAFT_250511 [Bipolaris maydis]KAJ6267706.1 hypothetical protein PSV08DRAFT_250824 [Bipolaris maydis]
MDIPQNRNLLIIKGSVSWKDFLHLLDRLLKKTAEISQRKETPQPWQVFSLICVSGDKRFIWNFHGPYEPTNYITSYNYNPIESEKKDPSVSDLFFQGLWVREYPDHGHKIIEYPLHGLFTSAEASSEFHNSHICISFRVPARDDHEIESEHDALKRPDVAFHFPFIVPRHDTTSNKTDDATNEIMLEAAAQKLADWVSQCSEGVIEKKTVAESNSQESSYMKEI